MIVICLLKYPKMLSCYLSEILEVSKQALVDWGNYIRETISSYYTKNPLMLGGENAVQIDESLFGGKRKYHRGNHHIHEKSWVFGMVEENTARCVFWAVERRGAPTLENIIAQHILPGSTIKSDEWGAYQKLGALGFNHLTVNRSVCFVSQQGVHTQLIESCWSQLKYIFKMKRGTSAQHLAGYLDLYSFICDARHQARTPIDLFIDLIQVGRYY
jgi:transposase